ncbi:MAG TPA: hypothetical protein VMU78_01990 [Methylocella sp.]|nr:hypothetical protein [Methylocella sp.]
MFLDEAMLVGQGEGTMADEIVKAVTGYRVERSEQWLALTETMPGTSYFATDLDPRSFERDETQGIWLGRAELLLKAPSELRPGQALQEVSFTMPVRVLLFEQDGALSVAVFDFYSAEEREAPGPRINLDDGPPKTIGWGPFEGLIKE